MKTFNELDINNTIFIYNYEHIIQKETITNVNSVSLSDGRFLKLFTTSCGTVFAMNKNDCQYPIYVFQNGKWIFSVNPLLILKFIISKKLPFIGIKIDGRLYDECEKYILATKIYEHKTF